MAKTKRYLSGTDILAIHDIVPVEEYIPEWDSYIHVRAMSGEEQNQFAEKIKTDPDKAAEWMICCCAVDADGNALWTNEQIPELMKKNWFALRRIIEAIRKVNKLGKPAFDETVKN